MISGKTDGDSPDASVMTPAELVALYLSPDFQPKYRETLNRCAAGERMTQEEFAAALGLAWEDFALLHTALFVLDGKEPVLIDDNGKPVLHFRQKAPVIQ